ncbi:sigma-70 family RNA polymerase sigma factor [Flavobacterium sp. MK4S-17]|uniref:sigma-70 family RNA polymerase sigma factor n=1 Tax=Flavobacterium sp. MK4S-17 TaxID=2543737 RepID=UPI00135B8D52|nr:sigma-70 family RNA polymerase sigma factor [Flavobacterium sp. MK4S-17]
MDQLNDIHTEFGQHLKNFIRSKVNNDEDVSDIYQNVILKIITKIDTLKKTESLKSWIFTIANNQIIDYFRNHKTRVEVQTWESKFSIELEPAENTNAYHLMEGCIHSLIAQLPDEYRLVIEQSELKGMSQKDLAQKLDMNYITLRSKVQRGRERLRKMLNDSCRIEQAHLGTVIDCKPKNASGCCGSSTC